MYVHKTDKDKKDPDKTKETVYLNIKFPDYILNEMGDKLGIETTLSYSFTNLFIKAEYKKHLPYCFNAFDADEVLEAMEEYLKQEIDFEYYMSSGIIESHFMLHKKEQIKHIQESMDKFRRKLIKNFYTPKWVKYIQPLNMIKNYYGEKYAF